MRTFSIALIALLVAFACVAMPSAARAACAGLVAARVTQDAVIPDKVDVHTLRGLKAQRAVQRYRIAIDQAQPCLAKGTPDERASALVTISQIRYIQAWILTHDGVPRDRTEAVAIATRSEREIKTFSSSHTLSGQNVASLDNWLHWADLMINKPAEACLGC
jgi:hypothetical protein